MSDFFKIINIPGLEGLIIEGGRMCDTLEEGQDCATIEVLSIINPNAVIGDRQIKFPVPEGALFIEENHLEFVPDFQTKEFSTKNPFGEFLFEGHLKKEGLLIDYAQYDNGVAVTIRDDRKDGTYRTVYAQNYFDRGGATAMEEIAAVMAGDVDVDDLVFRLKELKGQETK